MTGHIARPRALLAGRHEPLGAQPRDGGVNFAVFSDHAWHIDLCLFDASGGTELEQHKLFGPHDGVYHGFLPGAAAGTIYGLRAHGPYRPQAGHRFNPNKLLLDPYAREIVGRFQWQAQHLGYAAGQPQDPQGCDNQDNAALALKARVAAPLDGPSPRASAPRLAPANVVLYELHVKGFSMANPAIPAELRGSFSALAHPAAVAHFKALGVTTLSLLPVQFWLDEAALAARAMRNYWGYNTLGFFYPDPRLARQPDDPSAVVAEFRAMVAELHRQGLEVVLDVVYNHTAEGDETGPTLSFRGLDNASWYRQAHGDPGHCENLTGCGNTLNTEHPQVSRFVLDSLRYWVQELGVDGFRFDLAPVLGRLQHGFDPQAGFFAGLRQDPVLAGVHLIAEPWDAGHGGYQLGHFPGRFLEWNDRFRDAVRGYWLHQSVGRGELAQRFTASSHQFRKHQRRPTASVNFVAAHDGFTLADVVRYNQRHNLPNGEHNRDGREGELSYNFGTEGASSDPAINLARERVVRGMLATLLLAQGTPMLCAGDELGNSQQGNNNAYCQDNPTGWLDWSHADPALRQFVADAIALRRSEPGLRSNAWAATRPADDSTPGLRWLNPRGHDMQPHDWHNMHEHTFACHVAGYRGDTGGPHPPLMLVFNPAPKQVPFLLEAGQWLVALDSSAALSAQSVLERELLLPARSLVVLRQVATWTDAHAGPAAQDRSTTHHAT